MLWNDYHDDLGLVGFAQKMHQNQRSNTLCSPSFTFLAGDFSSLKKKVNWVPVVFPKRASGCVSTNRIKSEKNKKNHPVFVFTSGVRRLVPPKKTEGFAATKSLEQISKNNPQ